MIGMNFARVHNEKTCLRSRVVRALIKQFSTARVNKAKLILLVPVSRIRFADGDAAAQFYSREIGKSPYSYLFLFFQNSILALTGPLQQNQFVSEKTLRG